VSPERSVPSAMGHRAAMANDSSKAGEALPLPTLLLSPQRYALAVWSSTPGAVGPCSKGSLPATERRAGPSARAATQPGRDSKSSREGGLPPGVFLGVGGPRLRGRREPDGIEEWEARGAEEQSRTRRAGALAVAREPSSDRAESYPQPLGEALSVHSQQFVIDERLSVILSQAAERGPDRFLLLRPQGFFFGCLRGAEIREPMNPAAAADLAADVHPSEVAGRPTP
jgi:hypothetical protein